MFEGGNRRAFMAPQAPTGNHPPHSTRVSGHKQSAECPGGRVPGQGGSWALFLECGDSRGGRTARRFSFASRWPHLDAPFWVGSTRAGRTVRCVFAAWRRHDFNPAFQGRVRI